MEKNNLTMGIIGAMICIILLGGLLMPVVSSALIVTGDPIEIDNSMQNGYPYRYSELDRVELTITVTDSDFVILLNDQEIQKTSGTQPLLFSDTMYIELSKADNNNIVLLYAFQNDSSIAISVNTVGTTTCIFENGVWTLTQVDNTTVTDVYSWVVSVKDGGDYIAHIGGSPVYCKNIKEDLILCGFYSTGDLDTGYYCYKDGVLNATEGYKSSLSMTTEIYTGTTDILKVSSIQCTFTDGDLSETFTPYRFLVKESISGHSDSGAAYSMIGIVPIIAIVSVLIAAIYVFLGRKY